MDEKPQPKKLVVDVPEVKLDVQMIPGGKLKIVVPKPEMADHLRVSIDGVIKKLHYFYPETSSSEQRHDFDVLPGSHLVEVVLTEKNSIQTVFRAELTAK
jgi:hypothetical protein